MWVISYGRLNHEIVYCESFPPSRETVITNDREIHHVAPVESHGYSLNILPFPIDDLGNSFEIRVAIENNLGNVRRLAHKFRKRLVNLHRFSNRVFHCTIITLLTHLDEFLIISVFFVSMSFQSSPNHS